MGPGGLLLRVLAIGVILAARAAAQDLVEFKSAEAKSAALRGEIPAERSPR